MNVCRSTGTSNVACDINGIPTPIMQRVIELSDTPSFKRYICIVPLHWTTYKKNCLHFEAIVQCFYSHLWPICLFYIPCFLVFSGGIKWEHWPETSLSRKLHYANWLFSEWGKSIIIAGDNQRRTGGLFLKVTVFAKKTPSYVWQGPKYAAIHFINLYALFSALFWKIKFLCKWVYNTMALNLSTQHL